MYNFPGECRKKEVILSCTVDEEKVKPNNEEISLKAEEACLKTEEESIPDDGGHRIEVSSQIIKESSQMPAVCKKEQNVSETQKNAISEFKTPENDNTGSYLIKYNVSTPSLER